MDKYAKGLISVKVTTRVADNACTLRRNDNIIENVQMMVDIGQI